MKDYHYYKISNYCPNNYLEYHFKSALVLSIYTFVVIAICIDWALSTQWLFFAYILSEFYKQCMELIK